MANILIVDDEKNICFAFERFLSNRGHSCASVADADEAMARVNREIPDIVFLDIRLPGRSGLLILDDIQRMAPQTRVVMMTAYGTMDTAIEAMQRGAWDYLTKPIDLDQVEKMLARMLCPKSVQPLSAESHDNGIEEQYADTLIGSSQAIQGIYKMIGLLTTHDVPVLIEGESGVGKELVARAIHFRSDRSEFPFVAINCGAMPETLLESELFGHERGAFTGAEARKMGKFEHAGPGTIFLDEIGDLQFSLQIKLLRVLQERQLVRIGGLEPVPVRARIITATNKNLAEEVDQGRFRSDLYYRLQLITLNIPPLRERKEDIVELVDHFIHKANRELGRAIGGIETAAMALLTSYDWPGNVRELENVIKRAAIMARDDIIGTRRLAAFLAEPEAPPSNALAARVARAVEDWFRHRDRSPFMAHGQIHRNLVSTVEKTLIRQALAACANSQVKAAAMLGMNRSTLRKKIADYGIETHGLVEIVQAEDSFCTGPETKHRHSEGPQVWPPEAILRK